MFGYVRYRRIDPTGCQGNHGDEKKLDIPHRDVENVETLFERFFVKYVLVRHTSSRQRTNLTHQKPQNNTHVFIKSIQSFDTFHTSNIDTYSQTWVTVKQALPF